MATITPSRFRSIHTRQTRDRPYALNQIADALKVPRPDILTVLKDWTPEQLKVHLEQFAKADLMPPHYRS
jgi:hypothetical protein